MFDLDPEKIRILGEQLRKAANNFGVSFSNIRWSNSLSLNEQLMLKDVEVEFKAKELNVDKVDLYRMHSIYREYGNITSFYDNEAKQILKERELGSERDTKYDPTLNIEEAFLKYLGCSQAEAKKAHDLYYKTELKWQNHITELREKYNGSLGQLVGKKESDYEERANNLRETFSKLEGYVTDKFSSHVDNPGSRNH